MADAAEKDLVTLGFQVIILNIDQIEGASELGHLMRYASSVEFISICSMFILLSVD